MHRHYLFLVLSVFLPYWPFAQVSKDSKTPSGLMCDLIGRTDYQSIDGYPTQSLWSKAAFQKGQSIKIASYYPSFSWEMSGKEHNIFQYAYRILVSDNVDDLYLDKADVWDSEKRQSSQSSGVIYSGKTLQSSKCYYWKVKIWDTHGKESPYSAISVFYTSDTMADYDQARYPLQKSVQTPVVLSQKGNITRGDFGKSAFGQLKLTLTGINDQDTVTVRLGEVLNPDGTINQAPGGSRRYRLFRLPLKAGTYTYSLSVPADARNTGPQAIKMPPYIGEVMPFRYVEITDYQQKIELRQIVRAAVNYPFDDDASSFNSSDTVLNAVWQLCKYSVKATSFAGIYVDGDRERIPYEADTYINQLSHYATDREYTLARYSCQYLINHPTWPTEWALLMVLIAYNDYLYTGDLRLIQEFYKDLKAKTLIGLEDKNGLISTRTNRQSKELLNSIHLANGQLSDIVDWPHGSETDGFVFTDYNAVVNAFYYRALSDMAVMSKAIGHGEEERFFLSKAASVKIAFQKAFYDKKNKIYKDGIGAQHPSLHSNVFALAFGLVKPEAQHSVVNFIRSRGMACSVYGSQFLLDALYDAGAADDGFSLLTSLSDRSWYNMIRAGSTITMEAWDNKFKPNQDWNHAWGAAPANIISRKLMGVEPLSPGWSAFQIRPQPGPLRWASVKVPTIKGAIDVSYYLEEHLFKLKATIPGNTKANVILPALNGRRRVTINGQSKYVWVKKNILFLPEIGSGEYEITVDGRSLLN